MQKPSILQMEQAFLSAWPAFETEADGGWLRRASAGYTKRANCLQSMDPGDDTEAMNRILAYVEWTKKRKIPPVFRVSPLASEGVVAALNRLGWKPFDQSLVMAMPVGGIFTPRHNAEFRDARSQDWYQAQAGLSGYGADTVIALSTMLQHMTIPHTGVLVRDETGLPGAAALTNVNQGIASFLNVVVRPDLRGQGYGRSIMQAALNWSRQEGAGWATLQVEADNTAAVQLYRSLGFEEVYRYHYRQPQGSAA